MWPAARWICAVLCELLSLQSCEQSADLLVVVLPRSAGRVRDAVHGPHYERQASHLRLP
jgi:hypothetical protein